MAFDLHQIISGFSIFDDLAPISQFYSLKIIYHFVSTPILWPSSSSKSHKVQISNLPFCLDVTTIVFSVLFYI